MVDTASTGIDPHAEWLAERNAQAAIVNAPGCDDQDPGYEPMVDRVHELEEMILTRPATTAVGVIAKSMMSLILNEEGSHLIPETAREILAEARTFGLLGATA